MDTEKKMKGGEEEEEGAISKLPNDLLCHILSFLPTKEAALTSVLSKRWRDLFTLIPSLDIDDSIFKHGSRPIRCKRTSFMEFVNRVLALQSNSPITKFSVICHRGVDEDLVNDWLLNSLRRGATDITLILICPSLGYSLPCSIFSYGQNLIKLRLGCGDLDLVNKLTTQGDSFIFTKLRVLHLVSIPLGEHSTVLHLLLSKCPVLEELVLLNCCWRYTTSISSPTLQRLTIDHNHYLRREYFRKSLELESRDPYTRLAFNTPNLTYLHYSDSSPRTYPLVKMDSLFLASLDLGSTKRVKDIYNREHVRWYATNLIMCIHNVQILRLSSATLEVLSFLGVTLPVFHNLHRLSIVSIDDGGCQSLPRLLINCPNLQTLVFHGFHHMLTNGFGVACDGIFPSSSWPVKVLKISEFRGTNTELSLVGHLLKELPQLEQAIIVFSEYIDDFDIFEVSKTLEMLPRASLKCKLDLSEDIFSRFARFSICHNN